MINPVRGVKQLGGASPTNSQSATMPRVGHTYAIIAIVITAALFSLALQGCSGASEPSQQSTSSSSAESARISSSSTSESSSSSSKSSSTVVGASKDGKDTTDSIAVSDASISQDSYGRYCVSATVKNESDSALDATLNLKVTVIHPDNGVDYSSKVAVSGLSTDTPWITANSSDISVLGLRSGESRDIAIYPSRVGNYNVGDTDITLELPEFTVAKAKQSNTQTTTTAIPDFDSDLDVEILSFSGKNVSGSVTNNTGKYVSTARLNFVTFDSEGSPIAEDPNTNKRPTGVNVVVKTVKNLEPGATIDFDASLGDCSEVQLRDAYYDVNQSKS